MIIDHLSTSTVQAALAMVEEVRRQFACIPGLMEGTATPDYKRCVAISTDASLSEMIPPGCLVMLTPVIVGTLFGTRMLAGLLCGAPSLAAPVFYLPLCC